MKSSLAVQVASLLIGIACLSGCGGDPTIPVTPPNIQHDVYAVGFEDTHPYTQALLWKNNVPTVLDGGPYGALAYGVAFANGHVYVAGYESGTNNYIAMLWIDGVPTPLSDGTSNAIAKSLTVSGSDVYVAGAVQQIDPSNGQPSYNATYWKNGVAVTLDPTLHSAMAAGIAVDGSDVYVAGTVNMLTMTGPTTQVYTSVATYWKNGAPTYLTDGHYLAEVSGIAIQNGHVYVTGFLCTTLVPDCANAAYWMDGTATTLLPRTQSVAAGIAFLGADAYIPVNVGDGSNTDANAQLAVNGVLSPVSTTSQSIVNSILTSGTDVYLGGNENENAAYWENGTVTVLSGIALENGAPAVSTVTAMAIGTPQ